jgi:thiol-disulfide isomerase/thioredoxin
LLLVSSLCLMLAGREAEAQSIYSWTDQAGNPHIAESLREVPPAYRSKVKVSRIKAVGELPKGSLDAPPQWQKSGGFVTNASSVRLLVFTATWCGYCAKLARSGKIESLGKAVPSLGIEHVDIDADQERAKRYRVSGVPALVVVDRSGNEVGRLNWTDSTEKLAGDLTRLAGRGT